MRILENVFDENYPTNKSEKKVHLYLLKEQGGSKVGAAWFKGVMQVASYALRVWGSQEENSLDDSWYEYDHDAAILTGRYHHPTSQIIFYEEYQLPKIEILPF